MTDEIKDGEAPTPQAANNIRVDYTWYNTLVDDNGTGNGTIWDKYCVMKTLNSVDVGLTKLDAWGQWVDIPFSAANFTATGGTWTVGAPAIVRNRYAVIGKTLHWSIYVSWFSGSNVIGGAPTKIGFGGLPYVINGAQAQAVDYQGGIGGVPVVGGLYAESNGTVMQISKSNGAAFAASDVPGMIATMTWEIS